MYNLLVVDDEDFIVDGLIALFDEKYGDSFTYFRAYSSPEAIGILQHTRMDLVVSDIRMPGMTGIVLHEHIIRLWPACKVIFLTGFNDFEYIQTAIRNASVDYILKTESDEVIVQAVDKALASLRTDDAAKQLMEEANAQLQASLPILQKQYVWDMLNGLDEGADIVRQFRELHMGLRADEPVLLMLGRLEEWDDAVALSARMPSVYACQQIVKNLWEPMAAAFSIFYDRGKLVWLIQPHRKKQADQDTGFMDWEAVKRHAGRILATIQSDCATYLHLKISLIVAGRPVDWRSCGAEFMRLKQIFYVHYGLQQQLILSENDLPSKPDPIWEHRFYELRPNN
ncbi:response regulator [Cohnella soli]|uniref:Response regulator n=1 Tax=Cohnella soli TaxID=425005 RepID=A0ABW0I086_9BACL